MVNKHHARNTIVLKQGFDMCVRYFSVVRHATRDCRAYVACTSCANRGRSERFAPTCTQLTPVVCTARARRTTQRPSVRMQQPFGCVENDCLPKQFYNCSANKALNHSKLQYERSLTVYSVSACALTYVHCRQGLGLASVNRPFA